MTNFILLRPCGKLCKHTHTHNFMAYAIVFVNVDVDITGLSSSGLAYCMAGTSAALDEREVDVHVNQYTLGIRKVS